MSLLSKERTSLVMSVRYSNCERRALYHWSTTQSYLPKIAARFPDLPVQSYSASSGMSLQRSASRRTDLVKIEKLAVSLVNESVQFQLFVLSLRFNSFRHWNFSMRHLLGQR